MKRFIVVLLALVAVSLASAHSFTVSGTSWNGWAGTAEFAVEADAGSLLFGVSVTPGLDVEASFGVQTAPLVVEGGEFAVALRGHVPVYDGTSFGVGQVDVSLGLAMTVTDVGVVSPVFEVGARTPLSTAGLSSLPSFFYRVGISLDF